MIFQHTWKKVLSGEKTQTRRIVTDRQFYEPAEDQYPAGVFMWTKDTMISRPVYIVGKEYAVQPSRTQPVIYYTVIDGKRVSADKMIDSDTQRPVLDVAREYRQARESRMEYHWFMHAACNLKPLYIRITDIRREDVRRISQSDAKAEGFKSRYEFWEVWAKMHDKGYLAGDYLTAPLLSERPKELWDAWVLQFELVKE